MKIDITMDDRHNARFNTIFGRLISQLERSTHFSSSEVISLLLVYYKFAQVNGSMARYMTRRQFADIFTVLFDIYDERTVHRVTVWVCGGTSLYASPEAFVNFFAMLSSQDLEVRMQFVFKVYDTKEVGMLDLEVVSAAVEKFFTVGDEDEVASLRLDMTEFLIRKFDADRDNQISYEEYRQVVLESPQLLEFLGTVFPTAEKLNVAAHCLNILSIWTKYTEDKA